MRQYLVYLAGPITGLSYDGCTSWREYVCKEFQKYEGKYSLIQGVSPMRMKDYLSNEAIVKDHYEFILSTPKGIETRDHYDVERCDVLFANFLGATKVSIGSVLEIGYAHSYRKPIVVAMEATNIHQHSMLNEHAGYIVDNIEDAIYVIRGLCSP